MSSVLEQIRDGVVARLLTITGIVAVKAVPAWEMFLPIPGQEDVQVVTMPDSYGDPALEQGGCVITIDDGQVKALPMELANASLTVYRVPVYVALYVITDGTVQNAAQTKAWRVGETIMRNLPIYVPAIANTTTWPLDPDEFGPIKVDANTHGLLLKFWSQFQIHIPPE